MYEGQGGGFGNPITLVLVLAIAVIVIIGTCKVFIKCGKPAWAPFIPIYSQWVLFDIVGIKPWIALLVFIPVVGGIIVMIYMFIAYFKLAALFGKGPGFGLGLIFLGPIFICILGFGKAMPEGMPSVPSAYAAGTPISGPIVGPNMGPTPTGNAPDLMASDPMANGGVSLMTPDPVATVPVEPPTVERGSELAEAPSIEAQIMQQPVADPGVPIAMAVDQPPVQAPVTPGLNAFDLPTPIQPNETPIINEAPVVEQSASPSAPLMDGTPTVSPVAAPANNKFCTTCGAPNDLLNKFCISCGGPME